MRPYLRQLWCANVAILDNDGNITVWQLWSCVDALISDANTCCTEQHQISWQCAAEMSKVVYSGLDLSLDGMTQVFFRRAAINSIAFGALSFVLLVSVAIAQTCNGDITDLAIASALEACDESLGNTVCIAHDDVVMQMDSGRDIYLGDSVSLFDVREIIARPAVTSDATHVRWGVALVVIEPPEGGRIIYMPYGGIQSTTTTTQDETIGFMVRRSVDDGDCEFLEQGVLIETPTEDRVPHEIIINNVRIGLASRALILMNESNDVMRVIGMDSTIGLPEFLPDDPLKPGMYADIDITGDEPELIEFGIFTRAEREALVHHPQLLSSVAANRDLTDSIVSTNANQVRVAPPPRILEPGVWQGIVEDEADIVQLHMPGNADAWVVNAPAGADVRVLVACPGNLNNDSQDCVTGGLEDPSIAIYNEATGEIDIREDEIQADPETFSDILLEADTDFIEVQALDTSADEQYLIMVRGEETLSGRYMICAEINEITCDDPPRVVPINEPPEIVSANSITILNNGSAPYVIDARDPDGDDLRYSMVVGNAGVASVRNTGGGRFVIAGQSVGSTMATITVADDSGETDSASFTIFINPSCPSPSFGTGAVLNAYDGQTLRSMAGGSVMTSLSDNDVMYVLSDAVCVGSTNWYQVEVYGGFVGWVGY